MNINLISLSNIKTQLGITTSTGDAAIAHGLTGGKIISLTAVVSHATNQGMMPNQVYNAGYQFDLNFDTTNVSVNNIYGNSSNILSKPFIVTIMYEA